jgi:hypothetical protein
MVRLALLAIVGTCLAGCAAGWENTCASYGFIPGTPDFAKCMMIQQTQYQQSMRQLSGQLLANDPDTNMTCNRMGNTMNCNTW